MPRRHNGATPIAAMVPSVGLPAKHCPAMTTGCPAQGWLGHL